MTQKEAIAEIERLLDCAKKLQGPQAFVDFRPVPALEMALAALRGPTTAQPKGATYIDKICHKLYDEPKGCWEKTNYVCRICGGHLKTYYCEERLYLVGCVDCGTLALVKTTSPSAAAAAAGNAPGIATQAPRHETTEHSTWHEWIKERFGGVR